MELILHRRQKSVSFFFKFIFALFYFVTFSEFDLFPALVADQKQRLCKSKNGTFSWDIEIFKWSAVISSDTLSAMISHCFQVFISIVGLLSSNRIAINSYVMFIFEMSQSVFPYIISTPSRYNKENK